MDITLNICINDGSEILVDGFDKISFSNNVLKKTCTNTGYSWQKSYPEILNAVVENKFLIFDRHDEKDSLEYRDHSFAFRNEITEKNQPLILTTQSITTIIDMYN
ncbi:hypothetical protein [Enterococcus avium]|uniref:hypothetical protein n=1 Tax=Enterococcus avium TaxID=33945 RepID=UPI00289145C1|nr:hypothetical protein [Enterococcus avium]MDT2427689.1 hypothetical protein [Enterococcus avium]MDT2470543.1 hypothetical protein [Enterococcus avium]